MVAARVRDGGGQFILNAFESFHDPLAGTPSETYNRCLDAVQNISRATLFSPVTRVEAIQAMSEHFCRINYLSMVTMFF